MEENPSPIALPPAVIAPPTLLYHNVDLSPPPAEWTNVSSHVPDPARFGHFLVRALAWRMVPMVGVYGVMAAVWLWVLPQLLWGSTLVMVAAVGGFVLLNMGVTLVRLAFRFRKEYRSVRYVVADQGVQRLAPGYPAFVLAFAEVTRAQRFPSGLVLRTKQRQRYLALSTMLTGFDEIVARVAAATPLIVVRRPRLLAIRNILLILGVTGGFIGLFAGAMMGTRLWVELLLTALFASVSAWSLQQLWKSPHQKLLTKILSTTWFGIMGLTLLGKIVVTHLLAW